MSCPRPVGALGQGTFSAALVVGGHRCLPARAWVVGIMPDGVGGSWRLTTDFRTSPRGFACHHRMLSPGGGRALFITHGHITYLSADFFFSFKRHIWGTLAE